MGHDSIQNLRIFVQVSKGFKKKDMTKESPFLEKFYTLILRNINTNMTTENGRFRKISFKRTKKMNFKSTGTLTEQNNNNIPDIQ